MSEKQIRFEYLELADASSLGDEIKDLIQNCIDFATNAYAPYSQFKVSAVLKLENGEILKGANVENASYPVSICAERNLLSTVVSNYPDVAIECLMIYADADADTTNAVPPCGMCRQTLVEVEQGQNQPIKLYLIGKNGQIVIVDRCLDLLPLHFDGRFLKNG